MQKPPNIVVVTPAKNEGQIIRRFLSCCSLFADRIIILDQNSPDETAAICASFPKVEVYPDESKRYNEGERQNSLLQHARRAVGEPRLILALDVDEVPTANILTCPEWQSVLASGPGTVISLDLLEMLPGNMTALRSREHVMGLMDDGAEHAGQFMHSTRVPVASNARRLHLSKIKLLHYSLNRPELQAAKNRCYAVRENLAGSRGLLGRRLLYRYDYMANLENTLPRIEICDEWLRAYEEKGIDMTTTIRQERFWFDEEVERELRDHGSVRFHFDPIWNRSYRASGSGGVIQAPPKGLSLLLRCVDKVALFPGMRGMAAGALDILNRMYCRMRS